MQKGHPALRDRQLGDGFGCDLVNGECLGSSDYSSSFSIQGTGVEGQYVKSWGVELKAEEVEQDGTVEPSTYSTYKLTLPATLPAGWAILRADGLFAGAVAILFNPWSQDDAVYLNKRMLSDAMHDNNSEALFAQLPITQTIPLF